MSEIIVDGREIPISYYPDGAPRILFPNHEYIREIKEIVIRPKNMSSFIASMFFVDALKERGIKINLLTVPFIPGSRQDRLTSGIYEDFLFTAKSMCNILNDKGMRIKTFDPHSDVLSALLDRSQIVTQFNIFNSYSRNILDIAKYDGIISPDSGSEKKCIEIAKRFEIKSMLFSTKTRDISSGIISDIYINKLFQLVPDGKYLVIDDICDGGSTFNRLAESIKKDAQTEKIHVDLYVTHGIFSKGTEELLSYYKNIYCTDSTITPKPGVNIIKFFGE